MHARILLMSASNLAGSSVYLVDMSILRMASAIPIRLLLTSSQQRCQKITHELKMLTNGDDADSCQFHLVCSGEADVAHSQ